MTETEGDGADTAVETEACRWCSEALPERKGVKFCPHCGGDIRLVPCPACGEALEAAWRFCVTCGAEVAAP